MIGRVQNNNYTTKEENKVYGFSWSIIRKEDYDVREKNIHKICTGMGICASEMLEQGNVDALIEKSSDNGDNV